MGRKVVRQDEALAALIKRTADKGNRSDQEAAIDELGKSFQDIMNVSFGFSAAPSEASALSIQNNGVIQEGILDGDIISDIFSVNVLGWDQYPNYPTDLIAPGTEGEFSAYTMPANGRIPNRLVEGDEVTINTYRIANAIDWNIKYARAGRIDVVARALEVLRNGFVQKLNDDGWHTLIAAGLDRGLMTYDSAATAGQFTKKLLQLLKIAMVRNGGGNSASSDTFKLTDLYISPEAMQDIVSWTDSDLSQASRREVELSPEGLVNRLFGVTLHELTELGEGQKYTNYFTTALSGSLAAADVELVVGLDLSKRDKLIMPVRGEGIEIEPDDTGRRSGQLGYFGSLETSFGVLDTRGVILGSF